MSPITHRLTLPRAAVGLALTAMLLGVAPERAAATSPAVTRQAAAANAAFLAYAPPPPAALALCLVDTGVNANEDTTAGLVSATAIDGGTPADVDPLMHGTVDAAVAGGAGHGVLGAWPQLKIVSVRATSVPNPGQSPTIQFDDYINGVNECTRDIASARVAAIDLPLASQIPPTPDQRDAFSNAVAQAQAKGISILAAAGNAPGSVQLPASQPGVVAVGAGDPNNATCPFSATTGLTFYAPGCGIDEISTTDDPFCCGNGTSQASAFAAAVLVALRSYDPALTASQAVDTLLASTHNGHLDATAAFHAVGLDDVITAGNAAIATMTPAPTSTVAPARVARPHVTSVVWRQGVLTIRLKSIPKGTTLHVTITFAHRRARHLTTTRARLRVRTARPKRVKLRLERRGASGPTVTVAIAHRAA